MVFETPNYFDYSPLGSNVKYIQEVIGDDSKNTAISNRWITTGSKQFPVFGSGGSSITGSNMSYFVGSALENSRSSFGFSNFMPETTFEPFFDFNDDGFGSLARQSDLHTRMHSLSVSSDKSIASSSSNESLSFDPFAVARKPADSTTTLVNFEWSERQEKEPNSEKPDSSSECASSGLRPILGRNAEYYAKYGINTFPADQVLPTNFKYSLSRRTPRFIVSKPKPVRVLKKECVFCKRLGKPNYDSHWLKTSQNVVTCPELRTYKCSICGCQGGDNAHTYR